MCNGIAIFADNTRAYFAQKTNSHTDGAENLKINEDAFRKYEYYWWEKKLIPDHYDDVAEGILSGIAKSTANTLAKELVKENFSTDAQIATWLKNVPGEFPRIREVKSAKRRDFFLKQIFGMTQKEYDAKNVQRDAALQAFYKRIKNAPVFHPQASLSKKDIQLKVDVSFGFLSLPKVDVEFKYLSDPKDYADADTYTNAYADADTYTYTYTNAYIYAYIYANANANAHANARWEITWWWRIISSRTARFIFVEHLPKKVRKYTKQYKGNPFMPIWELFEMGLFPVGMVGKKYRIYVPLVDGKKPTII